MYDKSTPHVPKSWATDPMQRAAPTEYHRPAAKEKKEEKMDIFSQKESLIDFDLVKV